MYSSASKDDNVQSLRNSAQNLKDSAKNTASETKDSLRDTAHRAGSKVRSFIDSATSEITQTGETISGRIQDKPLQSALIALGVGVVISMLLRRRQ